MENTKSSINTTNNADRRTLDNAVENQQRQQCHHQSTTQQSPKAAERMVAPAEATTTPLQHQHGPTRRTMRNKLSFCFKKNFEMDFSKHIPVPASRAPEQTSRVILVFEKSNGRGIRREKYGWTVRFQVVFNPDHVAIAFAWFQAHDPLIWTPPKKSAPKKKE